MRVLRLFCVLCGLSVSAFALDREAFTITKYDLEIRLEPEQQRLGARGKITLRNDSAQSQKNAVLQISSTLSWRSIKADGKPLTFVSKTYMSDMDHTGALSEAIVTLPSEIAPKQTIEFEIGYEGTISQDATRLTQIGVPEEIAKHASWDQISPSFTAVRGAGYVAWYPIATVAADFTEGNSMFEVADRWRAREAESEFKANLLMSSATGEPPWVLICTPGAARFSAEMDRAQQISAECSWTRLGTVTPAFVMANLEDRSKRSFLLFNLPGHEAGAIAYTTALEPASKLVSEWFRSPTAPIAISDLADSNAAPFESGSLLLASMASDGKRAQLNLVHILVHSAVPSLRPWIHEGLAHFAEALCRAGQDGRQSALDLLGLHLAAFVDTEKELARMPEKNPGQPLATTYNESYYRSKAAYVWWMLRDMIGDDAFKQAIKKYRAEEDNDPKYVEQLLATTAKRDLGWFFDDWVYHDHGLPDFRVLAAHPWKSEGGKQVVTLTIENLGHAGAEVPFTVRFADGEVRRRIEVRAKSNATTRVEIPGIATEVIVNDGSIPESDLTNNTFKITEP